jgi:hypothetical protein
VLVAIVVAVTVLEPARDAGDESESQPELVDAEPAYSEAA